MTMDLGYLEQLLKIFDESSLTELEIEEEGTQVRLSRRQEPVAAQSMSFPMMGMPMGGYGGVPMPQQAPINGVSAQAEGRHLSGAAEAAPASGKKQHEVKSPIVGTFYRAPAPDADSYVEVGNTVSMGTTLCIIEAMKLMNEIESDAAGIIVKILVENGQPVEYGQPLMILEI